MKRSKARSPLGTAAAVSTGRRSRLPREERSAGGGGDLKLLHCCCCRPMPITAARKPLRWCALAATIRGGRGTRRHNAASTCTRQRSPPPPPPPPRRQRHELLVSRRRFQNTSEIPRVCSGILHTQGKTLGYGAEKETGPLPPALGRRGGVGVGAGAPLKKTAAGKEKKHPKALVISSPLVYRRRPSCCRSCSGRYSVSELQHELLVR